MRTTAIALAVTSSGRDGAKLGREAATASPRKNDEGRSNKVGRGESAVPTLAVKSGFVAILYS